MHAVTRSAQPAPVHTGADFPLPHAPRVRGSGLLTFAVVVMGTVALAAAVTAFVSLDRASAHHGAVVQRIADLRVETLRFDGLEWRMAAERGAAAPLHAAIVESRAQFTFALEELRELAPADSAIERLTRVFASYGSAVDAEIAALRRGDVGAARELDEERVDPSFDALVSLVHEIAAVQDARARREHETAKRTSIIAVAVALAALWLLAWRFHALRQSAVRAQASARVQQGADAKLRALFRQSSEAVIVLRDDFSVIEAGPSTERLLEMHPDDLRGVLFTDLFEGDAANRLRGWLEQPASDRGSIDLPFRRNDGSLGTFICDVDDARHEPSVGGLVAHLRDVTAEREAEASAHQLELRYQALFEVDPRPMWVFDRETLAFVATNEAAVRAYGWTREEFARMTIRDLRPAEDVPRLEKHLAQQSGSGPAGEWRHRRKDGSEFTAEILTGHLTFAGRPAVLVVSTDLTARKQLEHQLHQAQRLDAVGRLAGGVAHDFNNLLTAISGYSQMLLNRLPEETNEHRWVSEIRRASARAGGLTRQLMAFSRQQVLHPVVLDLNASIRETQTMLTRLIGEDIELVFEPGEGLGAVKADPGQMEQVVVNLAVNARDAMPNGGRLLISTRNVDIDEAWAHRYADLAPGPYVRLRVRDEGVGMDDAVRERVFEPFFTTKSADRGTGLGLSTVYGIVRQSGGHIRVESEPGRGATFEIDLPRVDEAAADAAAAKPREAPAAGNEHVLLVEDEEVVRSLVAELLGSLGYRVHAAASGAEAVASVRTAKEPFDLLLTDVVMPGIGGRETAAQVRELHPGLRVLYMSGYTDDAIVRHGVLDADVPFLAKPFTVQQLAATVRAALEYPDAA